MKPTKQQIYLMQCGHALSCWKVWQSKCFDYARAFDGQLFTKAYIDELSLRLNMVASTFRNYEDIRPVDWEWAYKYGGSPSISIGNGCSVNFIPVKGYYDGE